MKLATRNSLKVTAIAAAVLLLGGCGGGQGLAPVALVVAAAPVVIPAENKNIKPVNLGAVVTVNYDGTSDDLLTAGLGKTGLGGVQRRVAVR